jgi:hypothetical protein
VRGSCPTKRASIWRRASRTRAFSGSVADDHHERGAWFCAGDVPDQIRSIRLFSTRRATHTARRFFGHSPRRRAQSTATLFTSHSRIGAPRTVADPGVEASGRREGTAFRSSRVRRGDEPPTHALSVILVTTALGPAARAKEAHVAAVATRPRVCGDPWRQTGNAGTVCTSGAIESPDRRRRSSPAPAADGARTPRSTCSREGRFVNAPLALPG